MSLIPIKIAVITEPSPDACNIFESDEYLRNLALLSVPLTVITIPVAHYTGCHKCPQIFSSLKNAEMGQSTIGKDGFQIRYDVHQFALKQIFVKTEGHSIVVEGEQEEREDQHTYISRRFTRRHSVPEEFNIKDADSEFTSDGVLTINVPAVIKPLNEMWWFWGRE